MKSSIQKLGINKEKYDELFLKLEENRDGFISLYDGDKGNFKKINNSITSFKIIGPDLNENEISNFNNLLLSMKNILLEYIKGN